MIVVVCCHCGRIISSGIAAAGSVCPHCGRYPGREIDTSDTAEWVPPWEDPDTSEE